MKPDTPETDALEFEVIDDYECSINVTSSCLARKLERERDEARRKCEDHEAMIERMKKQLSHALEAVAENHAARKPD